MRAQPFTETHVSKGAERAQKANNHQSKNKQLSPIGQGVWVLIHYSCDYGL